MKNPIFLFSPKIIWGAQGMPGMTLGHPGTFLNVSKLTQSHVCKHEYLVSRLGGGGVAIEGWIRSG